MFRVTRSASASSVLRRRPAIQSRFFADAAPGKSGGSIGKKLFGLTFVTGGIVGGSVALANYNPDIRDKIESNVPQLKQFFDAFLASDGFIDQIKSVTGFGSPGQNPIVEEFNFIKSKLPKLPDLNAEPEGKPEKKGVEKDKITKRDIEVEDKQKIRLNQKLEDNLRSCISKAEEYTKKALQAKQSAITTILQHAKVLRETIEAEKDANWDLVKKAYEEMIYAKKMASEANAKAMKENEVLRKSLNEGLSDKFTANNPLLSNASHTFNNFVYQLEEMEARIRAADAESKIMAEFKDLVQKGREQFAFELKSVLPNVDINAKGDKLTEDELNSLIAHAHMRVDQLRRQLTEQQLRESEHLQQARERQIADDEKTTAEKIDRAMKNAREEFKVKLQQQMSKADINSEEELRAQLRRAAAAHSEHLEDVLRAQKGTLQTDFNHKLQDAIQNEREIFQREIATSMARLKGIEHALESRASQDFENRRAKELWLACQNLLQSVIHGRKAGLNADSRRKPLANELMSLRENVGEDSLVNVVLSSIDDRALRQGVFTELDLKSRFMKVRRLCRRTAMIGESGGNLWDYFLSMVQSLFIFDLRKAYCKNEVIDSENLDTFGILARAYYFVWKEDDLVTAAKLMQLLRGEPGRIANDWIDDVRIYLETKQAAEVLLAHAAASSIKTMY